MVRPRWVATRRSWSSTLDRVRPTDVEALILRLRAKGLAAATVQRIFIVLRLALDVAVRDGVIARNPASAVKRPSIERTEAVHLGPDEIVTLLGHAVGTRYYALFRLIATTGLRKGEALALKWDAIDLADGALHVRGTLARSGNLLFVTPPKTALSRRTLPLARAEIELLTELRATQLAERELAGPEWSDEDFVFTTESGRPMDPRNVLRALTTAASKAGLSGGKRPHPSPLGGNGMDRGRRQHQGRLHPARTRRHPDHGRCLRPRLRRCGARRHGDPLRHPEGLTRRSHQLRHEFLHAHAEAP